MFCLGVCRQCSMRGPLPFWLKASNAAALASPLLLFRCVTMAQWGCSAGRCGQRRALASWPALAQAEPRSLAQTTFLWCAPSASRQAYRLRRGYIGRPTESGQLQRRQSRRQRAASLIAVRVADRVANFIAASVAGFSGGCSANSSGDREWPSSAPP